ncbi:MAG TPA: DPP IV N-terminal domain-containing protein, partial [Candidatus Eremiobacteraceae bacterium]|nr:DPP IV N-terminal domain-containing protein [Candidatus Eremiobacteraceae bacterium]
MAFFSFCKKLSLFLIALTVFEPNGAAQSRRIELHDFSKIVGVSDPQISPDGKTIVIVVSRVNMEMDRNERELVLVDVQSGTQRVMTSGKKSVSSPRWSPSGDRLAFLSPDTGGKNQIFVLPMRGGDAIRITSAANGVEQFVWRPNGQDFAYVAQD